MATKTTENLSDAAKQAIAEAEAEENNDALMEAFTNAAEDEVFTVPPELAGHSKPGTERDEEQLSIDSTVEKYYEKWVAAGKPPVADDTKNGVKGAWAYATAAGVVAGYWVTPIKEPDKRKKIKSAVTRGGHSVKFGALGVRLPGMPQDGKRLLTFVVKDVVPRKK